MKKIFKIEAKEEIMDAKEFIENEWFGLTLDCKRDISAIYAALEDYAKYKISNIIKNNLL